MFSFDSVPAIIAVTKDPFLIYSAMIFAILGLRSMYFLIAALNKAFHKLDAYVAAILVIIAGKLLVHAMWSYKVEPIISMAVILSLLGIGVIHSLVTKPEEN